MPMVKVYAGLISISARSKDASMKKVYSNDKYFYGETLGEMVDNMVEVAMKITDETFTWVKENKPSEYTLKDDHWTCSVSHPQLLQNTRSEEEHDEGSSCSIQTVKDIVLEAVLKRDISIQFALEDLRLAIGGPSELPTEPKRTFTDAREATSFQEMSVCGFTGSELEEILFIGRAEGRMKVHGNTATKAKRLMPNNSIKGRRALRKEEKAKLKTEKALES